MPNKSINPFQNNPGFGLIETLIAGGIVAMVSAAITGLMVGIVRGQSVGADKISASNLAGEAIEIAHLIRDRNIRDSNPATVWNSGLEPTLCQNGCKITPERKFWNRDSQFVFSAGEDRVAYNGADYIRRVYFNSGSDSFNSLDLRVTVQKQGQSELIADISTLLTNWKE